MSRLLPFNSVYNFRDFGGYQTDIGEIAWGKLFRSGQLGRLNEQEFPLFNDLSIGAVIDMRYTVEQKRMPNNLPPQSQAKTLTYNTCLLYTSPSPRDQRGSRMPSSA